MEFTSYKICLWICRMPERFHLESKGNPMWLAREYQDHWLQFYLEIIHFKFMAGFNYSARISYFEGKHILN